MPEDMEFYVSPEFADTVGPGTVVTFVVAGKERIQSGILLKAVGQIISGGLTAVAEVASPVAETPEKDDASTGGGETLEGCVDLTSPPRTVSSFTVQDDPVAADPVKEGVSEKAAEKKDSPVSKSGISFGSRGPELVGVEGEVAVSDELPADADDAVPPKPPGVVVMSKEDFYELLQTIDVNDPANQMPSEPLTREEAVKQEADGALTYSGAQIYIVNLAPGQLVLSDIGVRMRFGDAYDLSRVPAVALKSSSDLFEAIANNLVKFITRDEMMKISKKTERRLEQASSRMDGIEVYDSADDVYDDIWEGDDDDRQGPQRRKRFSRGANYRSERYDDEVDVLSRASVNRTPKRFRDVRSIDILAEGENELDIIDRDVRRREGELGDGDEPRRAIDEEYDDDYGFASSRGSNPPAGRKEDGREHVVVARRDF
jgi:hypothetical protein